MDKLTDNNKHKKLQYDFRKHKIFVFKTLLFIHLTLKFT